MLTKYSFPIHILKIKRNRQPSVDDKIAFFIDIFVPQIVASTRSMYYFFPIFEVCAYFLVHWLQNLALNSSID